MTEATISVDTKVYSLAAVKKAAYRLGDRASAWIAAAPDGGLTVKLTALDGAASPRSLEAAFLRELLDQDLRESIARETEKVRNLLLAHAFSGLSPVDDGADEADFRDDPLGIARPQATGG